MNPQSSNYFQKQGVKLKYLQQFIAKNGGEINFKCPLETDDTKTRNLRTEEVVDLFIKEPTKQDSLSFLELMERNGEENYVGLANVFVSHAWSGDFLDLIKRLQALDLEENCPNHIAKGEEIVVWLDFFTNNQHTAPLREVDWWKTTFYQAVRDIGCTVFVLTEAAPTRMWCIWELFCTIDSNVPFLIASSQEWMESARSFLHGPLIKIDSENSECGRPEDKVNLNAAIGSRGFRKVDEAVTALIEQHVQRLRERFEQSIKVTKKALPQKQLLGIALDFSRSMEAPIESLHETAKGKKTENSFSRIQSVLLALSERLRKTDLSAKDYSCFVMAFGLQGEVTIGDMLPLLEKLALREILRQRREKVKQKVEDIFLAKMNFLQKAGNEILEDPLIEHYGEQITFDFDFCWEAMIKILKDNGAPYVRDYATKNKQHFSPNLVIAMLPLVLTEPDLLTRLVERLPNCCKSFTANIVTRNMVPTEMPVAKTTTQRVVESALWIAGGVTIGALLGGAAIIAAPIALAVGTTAQKGAEMTQEHCAQKVEATAKEIVEETETDLTDYMLKAMKSKLDVENQTNPLDFSDISEKANHSISAFLTPKIEDVIESTLPEIIEEAKNRRSLGTSNQKIKELLTSKIEAHLLESTDTVRSNVPFEEMFNRWQTFRDNIHTGNNNEDIRIVEQANLEIENCLVECASKHSHPSEFVGRTIPLIISEIQNRQEPPHAIIKKIKAFVTSEMEKLSKESSEFNTNVNRVDAQSVMPLEKVIQVLDILKDFVDNINNEDQTRIQEYTDIFDALYGRTPLNETFCIADRVFRAHDPNNQIGKAFLVISDGDATDEEQASNGAAAIASLKANNVKIATCFLSTISPPGQRLFSDRPAHLDPGQGFLFDTASDVHKNDPALKALKDRNWELPTGEKCRLFVHAHTVEVVKTFIDLTMDLGIEKDAQST